MEVAIRDNEACSVVPTNRSKGYGVDKEQSKQMHIMC